MGDEVTLRDENIPPIQEELFRLYSQGYVTDITLTCEDGKIFEAHKVILSARSNYFYNLIPKLKGDPVIFLKGVKGTYLEKILKYVYSGSAAVPRTQLRSLFDVARSLQIKGLIELSQGELGKGLAGPSCSKSMTMSPGSTKSDTDSFRYSQATREAREIALKQQQKLYDKFSSNSYKNKSSVKSIQTETVKTPSKKSKNLTKDVENPEEESFTFKYEHISDDSDDVENDDANDSDFELKSGQVVGPKYSRKKRGRPSKLEQKMGRKLSKSSSEGDTDSSDDTNDEPSKKDDFSNSSESDSDSDNSDLESEESESGSVTKSPARPRKDYSRLKKEPSPSLDDYYDAPAKRTYRRQPKGPAVNGQQILTVQCKGKRAYLHLAKFCHGSKGKSIQYKNQWMTPDDYEKTCGCKSRKYLDTITTDYGPLKTLTVSGFLKPHAKKCKCSICSEEDSDSPTKKNKVSTANSKEESTSKPMKSNIPENLENPPIYSGEGKSSPSKRKKAESVDAHKRQKLVKPEEKAAGETRPNFVNPTASDEAWKSGAQEKEETLDKVNPKVSTATTLPSQVNSPNRQQAFKSGEILSPPTLTTTKMTISPPITSNSNISTFSPSSTDSLSPTFISLSTASQISPKPPASLGSSMIPFPSKLSGIPSPNSAASNVQRSMTTSRPVYSTTPAVSNTVQTSQQSPSQVKSESKPIVQPQSMKPQIAIQMGPVKMDSTNSMMATGIPIGQHQGSYQLQRSRLGAVMQVRCKAVSAYLYTNKYESGSKGKCILLADEWLTPNEFEEKSGSKAKKYLSSIKCLGRPLRAYVNSGELRGSGPPPSPKPPRAKSKPPQPIAPAPPHGMNPGQINMAQLSMPPPGMSSAHLSQSYTPVAMMGSVSVAGQPILINQSSFSMATSGMTQGGQMGTPILTPMTFTLSPMTGLDGRQSIGVQQQMHGGQHM